MQPFQLSTAVLPLRLERPFEPVEYTFVFGPNGSGKTSLARALHEAAEDAGLEVLRFDREYTDKVLAQSSHINGLWIVAKEASGLVDERERLRGEIGLLSGDLDAARNSVALADGKLQALLRRVADELRPLKRAAESSAAQYSAAQVRGALDSLAGDSPGSVIDALRLEIEQAPLQRIRPEAVTSAISRLSRLLDCVQTGGPELRAMERADWVTQGLDEQLGVDDPCPFCGQHLGREVIDRIREVARLRPATPERRFSELEELVSWCHGDVITPWPDPSEFDVTLAGEASIAIASAQQAVDSLAQELPRDASALVSRLISHTGPGRPPWFERLSDTVESLAAVGALIGRHEALREEQSRRRLEALADYEAVRLHQERPGYRRLCEDLGKAESEERRLHDALLAAREALRAADAAVRGLMDPTELNGDLLRYLGHRAIRFETSGDGPANEPGYRIVRFDGSVAKGLSEGERTAIAFLYFLRECRTAADTSHPPEFVVVDDPVTSLDDGAVFSSYAFLKEGLSRPAGETGPKLVVLTHSSGYFRLLADWAWRLNHKHAGRAALHELFTVHSEDHAIECRVQTMDPAVAQSGSEYAMLLAKMVSSISSSAPASPNDAAFSLLITPNVARRVLESFLGFKFGGPQRTQIADLLEKAFNDPRLAHFGGERRERLHRLLNIQSHGDGLTDLYAPITSRAEVKKVVLDVLDLMKALDSDHLAGFGVAV